MTTVGVQPRDKTTIVPVGNHTCPGQIHIWWVFGGENHGVCLYLTCRWMHLCTNFSALCIFFSAAEASAAAAPTTFAGSIEAKCW